MVMNIFLIRELAKKNGVLDKPLFFDWKCDDGYYRIRTFIAKKDFGFHWMNSNERLIDGIEAYIEGNHNGAVKATVREIFEYIRRKDQQYLDFFITYCPDDDFYGCSRTVNEGDVIVKPDGIHIRMRQ